MKKQNYYTVLGIPKGATPEEIRQSYRALAMRFHPDRNPENPGWKFPVYMGLHEKSWLRYPQTEPGLLEHLRSVSDGSDNDYKYFKDDLLNKDGHTRMAELYYEHYKKTYLENQN